MKSIGFLRSTSKYFIDFRVTKDTREFVLLFLAWPNTGMWNKTDWDPKKHSNVAVYKFREYHAPKKDLVPDDADT